MSFDNDVELRKVASSWIVAVAVRGAGILHSACTAQICKTLRRFSGLLCILGLLYLSSASEQRVKASAGPGCLLLCLDFGFRSRKFVGPHRFREHRLAPRPLAVSLASSDIFDLGSPCVGPRFLSSY